MTKRELKEQEEIQKCLNCQYPECVNCLGPYGRPDKIAKRHSKWEDTIKRCVAEGMSDRKIAVIIGVDHKTVGNLRRSFGIPSIQGRGRPRGSGTKA
jgi:transposase-like protein